MHVGICALARGFRTFAVASAIGLAVSGCETPGASKSGEYRAEVPEGHNMRLVGYNDLQARSAYQPVIHRQGNRYIAYVGHHGGIRLNPHTGQQEQNGTSIIDVSGPAKPRYLVHIQGDTGKGEAGGAQMV